MNGTIIFFVALFIVIVGVCYFFFMPSSKNILKLLSDYLDQTEHLSAPSGMRKALAYQQIITMEKKVVIPAIINEIRQRGGRMALYVLLWELTGVRPNHPLQEDGLLKYDIKAEEKAWLKWAEREGI